MRQSRFYLLTVLMAVLFSVSVTAADIHTWHNVTVTDPDHLSWKCQLSPVYETDMYFVDAEKKVITEFEVNGSKSSKFGFAFGSDVDFNLLFSLACARQDGRSQHSPKTVFVIGADGPADPNIHINNFYNGTGTYTVVPGVGENFVLTLKKKDEF